MKYVLYGFNFWKLIYTAIESILVSLLISGIYWFFYAVLMSNPVDFLIIWKWVYIAVMIVRVLYIILVVLARLTLGYFYSKKWNANFTDVVEAFAVYEIAKKDGWQNFTEQEFVRFLNISRTSTVLADAITRSLGL